MNADVNGDPGADGDYGLRLQPTVSWPHVMTVGRRHLVEVDLDFVTTSGSPSVSWPFDQEEYAYTCVLGGGDDFSLWAVHDASVVVHRFGGSYGPAQFVVTPNAKRAAGAEADTRLLRLTILNPWGVPIDSYEYELEVRVRTDDGAPFREPTVDTPVPKPASKAGPGPAAGNGTPAPGPDELPPAERDSRPEPLASRETIPPSADGARPAPDGLPEQYGLVALLRSRSGSLHFDRVPLFSLGADVGYTVSFAVRCLPSGDQGTVFATFAESPADPDAPPRLLTVQSAQIPPGTYQLTAELLHPYPGYVRFRGLPEPLHDDPRSWNEIVAAVPARLPTNTGPAHLIAVVEVSGEPAMVLQRIERVTELVQHVAGESTEPASYSVITYGPHRINNNRDDFPEIPVSTLAWAVPAESALDTLGGLARHGALAKGYPFAAQLECVLADLANRLTGREGRPVLVTAGARPPHPPKTDPETGYIPCPERNDGLALRAWLENRHPGMSFGAIRDSGRVDHRREQLGGLWEQLGSDVANGAFYAPDFAKRLRLTGQPAQVLPLPLLVG